MYFLMCTASLTLLCTAAAETLQTTFIFINTPFVIVCCVIAKFTGILRKGTKRIVCFPLDSTTYTWSIFPGCT